MHRRRMLSATVLACVLALLAIPSRALPAPEASPDVSPAGKIPLTTKSGLTCTAPPKSFP